MNKQIKISVFVVIGLVLIFYIAITKRNNNEPVVLTESASLRELTIDDKINEAQIIVIGELKTTLPSKWKFHNDKDVNNATPQEVLDAGGLFTDFLISIDQTLKGNIEKPIIRVRSFVGETEQVRWEDSSETIYRKGHMYLLFLRQDFGPTANIDSGDYISVNANTAVYEIVDGKAISAQDEWALEELIAYIQKSLFSEAVTPTLLPPVDLLTETFTALPLPTETPSPTLTPAELPIETPTPTETPTP